MATFKPDIQYKRADDTYNIRIRVTHNCKIRRLSTNLFATSADMTKSLKLKNQNLIDQINAQISQCRTICNELGFSVLDMNVDDLTNILKTKLKGGEKFKLDFIAFANDEIDKMKNGTAAIYNPAFNALKRFIKRDMVRNKTRSHYRENSRRADFAVKEKPLKRGFLIFLLQRRYRIFGLD